MGKVYKITKHPNIKSVALFLTQFKIVLSFIMQTQKLGLALTASLFATPISSAISGPLFNVVGYYGIFAIGAACNFMAFLYILFFVTETVCNVSLYELLC